MQQQTIYAALGGQAAIEVAVDRFYARVLADPQLAPFFAATDLKRLAAHQRAFFAMALGGPARYRGRDMRAAHAGRGITEEHFDRVAHHLGATLAELGVSEELRREVLTGIAPLRAEVAPPA
jgi:hemoglobin